MKVIVGLGNPGDKYKNSRHNVGFMLLDKIVDEKGLEWVFDKKSNSEIAKDEHILYAKPQIMMNRSGESVAKILSFYKLKPGDLTVVNDDVDLEFGEVRKQSGRGSAGHRGVQSIIENLGTNSFERIRIGLGRPENAQIDTNDWVMADFTAEELKKIQNLPPFS